MAGPVPGTAEWYQDDPARPKPTPASTAPSSSTSSAPQTKRPRQPSAGADTPDTGGGSGGRRPSGPPTTRRPPAPSPQLPAGGAVDTGAGLVLAVLFWAWLGLPMLRGGPAEVKKTLRAKWLNQAPDGSWLK